MRQQFLEKTIRQQNYIIENLRKELLLIDANNQKKIDKIIRDSKDIENLSTEELHMFPWLELGE